MQCQTGIALISRYFTQFQLRHLLIDQRQIVTIHDKSIAKSLRYASFRDKFLKCWPADTAIDA